MKKTMQPIEFWQTVIVHYRNRKPKKLKEKVELAKALNAAWGWLKYAESKILVVLVLGMLFVSGCATAKGGLQFGGGIMQDLGWLMSETAENINTEKE